FGAAVGYATLGRIGYEGRYDYAAIGNVTILASRLSARAAAGQILVSQRLNAALEGKIETEPVGELELKGMTRPVAAFSVTRAVAAAATSLGKQWRRWRKASGRRSGQRSITQPSC